MVYVVFQKTTIQNQKCPKNVFKYINFDIFNFFCVSDAIESVMTQLSVFRGQGNVFRRCQQWKNHDGFIVVYQKTIVCVDTSFPSGWGGDAVVVWRFGITVRLS